MIEYKSPENIIIQVINNNSDYIKIVQIVSRYTNYTLWVGGGFIRSIIWDHLSSHKINSELGDIDVFYYDTSNISKEIDLKIESDLCSIAPNINWSVKNQARMHLHNDEPQYVSFVDALSKFPDTASTIVVRSESVTEYCFLAPFGYTDLFNLRIKATPHFIASKKRMEKYNQRIINKRWLQKWPRLQLID